MALSDRVKWVSLATSTFLSITVLTVSPLTNRIFSLFTADHNSPTLQTDRQTDVMLMAEARHAYTRCCTKTLTAVVSTPYLHLWDHPASVREPVLPLHAYHNLSFLLHFLHPSLLHSFTLNWRISCNTVHLVLLFRFILAMRSATKQQVRVTAQWLYVKEMTFLAYKPVRFRQRQFATCAIQILRLEKRRLQDG